MRFLWSLRFPKREHLSLSSKMTEFYYQEEYSDKFGKILRPIALVSLKAHKRSIQAAMYIDSGADVTMIPFRAGNDLGFRYDPNKIFQMSGIAGSLPCLLGKAEVVIGNQKLRADITWALSDEAPFLLGRKDIFHFFRITFDENKRKIEFWENTKLK